MGKTCVKIILLAIACFILGAVFGAYFTRNPISFGHSDLTCVNGDTPDKNGCCIGEVYTDMGDLGFNCCPEAGGDCFPPIR